MRGSSMDPTILIIEDDRELACLLRDTLQDEGYQALLAGDGVDGVQLVERHHPDLVLLDLMMPRMDGWEACQLIRESSDVPIIIITGRRNEADKIRGLQIGADDYVVKPFSVLELIARIQAALRRYNHSTTPDTFEPVVQIDERLTLDKASKHLLVDGQSVELSDTEYKLLSCFLEKPGTVLTHQMLLTQVWGREYLQETGYLKVYIYRLRSKIERDPQDPQYLLTVRGRGYYFQVPG
jgi:two-component system, OmpR family, KDP operon response regulator KdpE